MRFLVIAMLLCFSNLAIASTPTYNLALQSENGSYYLAKAKKKKKKKKKKRAQVEEQSDEESEDDSEEDRDGPTVSIEANPLGLLLGIANAEVNFAVSEKMTIGPQGSFFTAGSLTGYGIGGTGYYYFKRLFEGLFFNAQANYSFVSLDFLGIKLEASGFGAAGIVGYKWLWDSFLIGLGAGVQFYSFTITSSYDETETAPSIPLNGAGLALLFNIGVPF